MMDVFFMIKEWIKIIKSVTIEENIALVFNYATSMALKAQKSDDPDCGNWDLVT